MKTKDILWHVCLIFSLCLIVNSGNAQSDSLKAFEAGIFVKSRYTGDSITLRWAPTTPGAWALAQKSGFVIERAILDESGSFDPATFQRITPSPLKPWPLERWATIAGQQSKDDFTKVAAQALYGKSLTPSKGFIAAADEFATRFSFAMLAADISANASRALGLRFTERNVIEGKTYVYRISTPVDTNQYKIFPGMAIVNTSTKDAMPQAEIADLVEKEHRIEVQWNREFHTEYFSAYYIERSDDNGKTFKRLNRMPFIHPLSEKNSQPVDNIVYSDSIPANYKVYWYRLIGITPFGEVTKPSVALKAIGRDRTPPPAPMNVRTTHMGGKNVRISWEYPKQTKAIKGFLIGRGDNPSKRFTPITVEPLSPKTREFIDANSNESGSNYYVVAAVDTSGNAAISLAQYALIIDSIPPSPPKGLAGSIDSAGVVTVRWSPGIERDIKGYLVFFANKPDHEFAQLTHGPVPDTVFQDTTTLKTLTRKIYYRVVAVDYNSNYSAFSEILELKRPDVVPPSQAVVEYYRLTETGIELKWVPSSSEDVAETILYRWSENEKNWKELASFKTADRQNAYLDTAGLVPGKIYTYSLVAVDEDGLRSKHSIPTKVKFADIRSKQPVKNLFAKFTDGKSIHVNWNYPVNGDYRFIVYRAVDGSGFMSYKSFDGKVTSFTDNDVKKGRSYEYSIGVIYKDGKKAPFGSIVKTSL